MRYNNPVNPWIKQLETIKTNRGLTWFSLSKLVGVSHSFMSKVSRGAKLPGSETIVKWADALELTGAERASFIRAGHLAHSPDYIDRAIRSLECDVRTLTEDNRRLREALAEYEAIFARALKADPSTPPPAPAPPDLSYDPFAQLDAEVERDAPPASEHDK
jgi:transcriptional regulator with XRE-family HTH domain